ncbi:MAG TPA: hypothetical protein VHV31_01550 [Nitrolancea sp.]|jgi:hypothetical protein|nr:hypothetical protein [Nitrolancea sp.]
MTTDETNETGVTVVAVPADQAQAVIDFVRTLETEETDVTGHMIPRGGFGGSSFGGLSVKHSTDTGCVQTTTGSAGVDFKCSDTDTLTF